jgi:putative ABC transport system permease protein
MRFTKTAFKIAWRESRASSGKFLFVVFAVAIGVGSLTGVRGFSQALATMLLREARTLMAADVSVRLLAVPTPEQLKVVESYNRRGTQSTRVTETLSMVSSKKVENPAFVSVKAVDPAVYPFYGRVTLDPPSSLASTLTSETTIVSDDLQIRLNVGIGDTIRVGGVDFRIAAIVTGEPDRLISGPAVGPRVLLSRDGLQRTELIRLGSRAPQRILFKVPPSIPLPQMVEALKKAFPDDQISDYKQANQNVTRALDFATSFLSLISLIALIVGGVGVATAMHAHLKQKLDSIAIMKSIGGRSSQIVQIYIIQTVMLGLAGGILGIAIGSGVQHLFPAILQKYFQVKADIPWLPSSAVQGIVAGLLTTLLFTLPPLLSIQKIKPGMIFRRDMVDAKLSWKQRLLDSRGAAFSSILIIVGLGALAVWLIGGASRQEAFRVGSIFTGGLLTSLLILAGVAWVLLRLLRIFVAITPWKLPPTLRHGIANLYRPGSQAESILTSLGIGVMFTLTVYLVQHSMLAEISGSAPPGMSNVFLLDITEEQRARIADMLSKQPGLEKPPELLATVSSRMISIDGIPMEDYKVNGKPRRFGGRRILTSAGTLPDGMTVTQGAWWKTPKPGMVSVSDWIARGLNLHIGSNIEWLAFGKTLRASVTSIHRIDPHRISSRIDFILTPQALEGLPTVYYGAVRMKPSAVAALQRVTYEQFPTVTVLNMADVIERVQEVVNQVGFVIRLISLFAILAGATILASSVAGTRFRRVREVVIFKTLGATRSRIARIFSAEFLILGTVAGVMGSLLAIVFSMVVMKQVIKVDYQFNPLPILIAIALTALIAAAAGWLASFRILGQKPLEVLRGE